MSHVVDVSCEGYDQSEEPYRTDSYTQFATSFQDSFMEHKGLFAA